MSLWLPSASFFLRRETLSLPARSDEGAHESPTKKANFTKMCD